VDGLNPFAYASANPVLRVDPLGLYQQDVHYYMTLFLAITAGVNPLQARHLALASAFVDENPSTRPLEPGSILDQVWSATQNQLPLIRYHFVLSSASDGQTLSEYSNGNVHVPIQNLSPQMRAMWEYATRAPSLRDGVAGCSDDEVHLQFLGEYLHAFADTFSHRDQNNVPYDAWRVGFGVGHGPSWSEPDYTYRNGEWVGREARTFSMELALREQIRHSRFANRESAITDRQLDTFFAALNDFNQTREDEEHSMIVTMAPSVDERWIRSNKVRILNQALIDLGYEGIDLTSPEFRFDVEIARELRRTAFGDLDVAAYPMAILDTP